MDIRDPPWAQDNFPPPQVHMALCLEYCLACRYVEDGWTV